MCKYTKKKNKLAPFAWIDRITHPLFTSRQMCEIELKDMAVFPVKCIAKNKPEII